MKAIDRAVGGASELARSGTRAVDANASAAKATMRRALDFMARLRNHVAQKAAGGIEQRAGGPRIDPAPCADDGDLHAAVARS